MKKTYNVYSRVGQENLKFKYNLYANCKQEIIKAIVNTVQYLLKSEYKGNTRIEILVTDESSNTVCDFLF